MGASRQMAKSIAVSTSWEVMMKRKRMEWSPRGVARSRRGKLLLVLELGDGRSTEPPTAKLKALLERKGLWADGMTTSQAWWLAKWSLGRVTVSPDQTEAEVAALRKRKEVRRPRAAS